MNRHRLAVAGLAVAILSDAAIFGASRITSSKATSYLTMRSVSLYQFDDTPTKVIYLSGSLTRSKGSKVIDFNDVSSFEIHAQNALVVVPVRTIAAIINRTVVPASHADLSDVRVELAGQYILLKGKTHKLGVALTVEIESIPTVSPEGELRLHIRHTKIAKLIGKGVLDKVGLRTDSLIKPNDRSGIHVTGDDITLPTQSLFPAPRFIGKINRIRVSGDALILKVGSITREMLSPGTAPYINLKGGSIRFAHIIMPDANLRIVPLAHESEFRFSPRHYYAQMVRGYSSATDDYGLVGHFADFGSR